MKTPSTLYKLITVFVLASLIVASAGFRNTKADTNYLKPAQATGRFDFHAEPGDM